MAVGHTFTIEPMVNERSAAVIEWPDKWTIATADGGRSAQFEHTLLIVPGGVEILTPRTENSQPAWWDEP
jgi:methionyl aminopeptidase